jgi:ribosomal protein S27E
MSATEMKYMRKHAPSCLGQHSASAPPDLTELIQSEYGPNTTVFAPRCPCGEERMTVFLPEGGFGRVSLKCAGCATPRIVFDPLKHGYNGALGNNQGMEAGLPSVAQVCPKCGATTLRVAAGFQYSGETDILEEEEDLDVKPEDLFGWFIVAGSCSACGHRRVLFDIECA